MYEENYMMLGEAIVKQAAKDYVSSLKSLRLYPEDPELQRRKAECERFFRSEWYMMLTKIDGEYLIRRLQEDVKRGR